MTEREKELHAQWAEVLRKDKIAYAKLNAFIYGGRDGGVIEALATKAADCDVALDAAVIELQRERLREDTRLRLCAEVDALANHPNVAQLVWAAREYASALRDGRPVEELRRAVLGFAGEMT
jgi:hypothetical protein